MPPTTTLDVIDPQAFQNIVGATFAKAEHRPIITIGNRSWSKWDLGRIGCPHSAAAARVQQLIQQLEIRTPKEFIERAPEFGRYKRLGVTCYWTVLSLARDLGADIEDVHHDDRSFGSIHREALKSNGTPSLRRRRRSR